MEQLEAFTCVMYNQAFETSVYLARNKMLKIMVGEVEALSSRPRARLAPAKTHSSPSASSR